MGTAAKASSVGANTVNGPSPRSVSSSPAACTADTSVVKLPASTAVSTMSFGAIVGDGDGDAASSVVLPHAAITNGTTIRATTMRMMLRTFIVVLQLSGSVTDSSVTGCPRRHRR